ncbi:MAG: hypothetical protein HRT74_07385 [Flavobacteriales bacterium]|nr:hypothetical protein [Flavobacteriales bacterium]
MRQLLTLILIGLAVQGMAQDNLQNYTPSILFGKGEWEVKSFQNVYTQTASFGSDLTNKIDNNGRRDTYSSSINQFLYGINGNINIGLDVWVKNVTVNDPRFETLTTRSRTEITGIGPKIKIAPFKKLNRLSIQSTLLFPLAEDLEGADQGDNIETSFLFLEYDRSAMLLNQLFYDLPLNSKWQLFFQQAFWTHFTRDSFAENTVWQTQTSLFVSYFATSRWTLYGLTEYFPTHYNAADQEFSASESFFINSGIGTKYQIIPNKLEIEALYSNFWLGSEGSGAGQTFNIGLRFIRQ